MSTEICSKCKLVGRSFEGMFFCPECKEIINADEFVWEYSREKLIHYMNAIDDKCHADKALHSLDEKKLNKKDDLSLDEQKKIAFLEEFIDVSNDLKIITECSLKTDRYSEQHLQKTALRILILNEESCKIFG